MSQHCFHSSFYSLYNFNNKCFHKNFLESTEKQLFDIYPMSRHKVWRDTCDTFKIYQQQWAIQNVLNASRVFL